MNKKHAFVISALLIQFNVAFSQKKAPENWFNLDPKTDKVYGVSTNRAYNELLKDKKSKPVIVAVIDGGTEVAHEDLKNVIWVNGNEILGNGIDDDKNGYIDDVNGWSFIGGKDSDVVEDNLELTRVYRMYKNKYDLVDATTLQSDNERDELSKYLKAKKAYLGKKENEQRIYDFINELHESVLKIVKSTGKENPNLAEIKIYTATNKFETMAIATLSNTLSKGGSVQNLIAEIKGGLEHYDKSLNYQLNPDFDPRSRVGDNYNDLTEKYYGNTHVSGPKGDHGTHVAGIIAASRNNDLGINGVADNVKIMVLRVVPDGDERDKDIANSIRYAVDNGAKIINMSFGKDFSPFKSTVDDAVKYAVSKDVLLIHAAGNDAKDLDKEENFPNDRYLNSTELNSSWIEVGASSWQKKKATTAVFSNYGKINVDVFAPGVDIYSCIPENKYASFNGTSMAAPVTAGVAAVLRSYFPELTAQQTKEIILESAIRYKKKVYKPGSDKKKEKVLLSDLCVSGGIVNVYEAVKLAMKK